MYHKSHSLRLGIGGWRWATLALLAGAGLSAAEATTVEAPQDPPGPAGTAVAAGVLPTDITVVPVSPYLGEVLMGLQPERPGWEGIGCESLGREFSVLLVPAGLRGKSIKLGALATACGQMADRKILWSTNQRWILDYAALPDALVTSMVAALQSEDPAKRLEACWDAGGMADPRIVAPLLAREADPATAEAARMSLHRLGWECVALLAGEQARPAIERWLDTCSDDDSFPAVRALGLVGNSAALKRLEALAKNAKVEVRKEVPGALWLLGPAGEPALTSLVADANLEVRAAALHCLSRPGNAVVSAMVAKALTAKESGIRAAAVHAYGTCEPAKKEATALAAVVDPAVEVRTTALMVLAQVKSTAALAAIRQAVDDPTAEVRAEALEALAVAGGPKDLPVFEKRLTDTEPRVICMALTGAARVAGDEAAPMVARYLMSCTNKSDEMVMFYAGMALGTCAGPQAYEWMEKLSHHPSATVRAAVRHGLKFMDRTKAMALVETGLRDPEGAVREAVVSALGEMPGPTTLVLLDRALKDSNEIVRQAVPNSLIRQGSPAAIARLQALAKAEPGDEAIAYHVFGALAESGGPQALAIISGAATSGDFDRRALAATSIGGLRGVNRRAQYPLLDKLLNDVESVVRSSAARTLASDFGVAGRDAVLARLPKETQRFMFDEMVEALKAKYPDDPALNAAIQKIPRPREEE